MPDDPVGLDPRSPEGGPRPGAIERLDESECLRLIGAERVGHLGYTSPVGPTVLPVLYKLYERSIVFYTLQGTFTDEDLRTGIANAEYRVAFEVDQFDPEKLQGWAVVVVGSAHHVDTEAERASIISAGADPWPEAGKEHLIRVQPIRIAGRRRHGP